MADQNIAFTSIHPKAFNNGVGYIEYALATLASGSTADLILPKWVTRVLMGEAFTSAKALIGRASYTMAVTYAVVTAATGSTPVTWSEGKITLTGAGGGLPNAAKYVALVVL